jgi:hypothetical protein
MSLWQPSQLKFFQHKAISVDRKAVSGTAVSITDELKKDATPGGIGRVQEINLYFNADVYATWAENIGDASSQLASDGSRRKFFCGQSISYMIRDDNLCLFVALVDTDTEDERFVDRELYVNKAIC